jgi:hypothetical protein
MAQQQGANSAAHIPQLATFAPSREDVLSTLAYFFGAPASPEKLKDYSEHHAATYHFPDAFSGTNVKLRDTLNNLVLRSPQNWQTSVGLPFLQINNTTVEWDEVHFDVRLLQRVPYEGVSRMTTSLKRARRDRVVRRGLAMMIESDFYATEAGRAHFANTLTSIRYCIQETCNFDVLFSYLSTSNYDFKYDLRKALRPAHSVKTAMRHEIMMYAVCQKEGLGMDKAVEEVKFRMSRYGVRPNMMVIPPQLALYMALAPEEKTLYAEGGPKADAQFESGVEGFQTRSFRGLGVVTSEPFEIADDSESVQMLTRATQVGEHYVMSSPEPGTPLWQNSAESSKVTGFCDVVIYDEDSDRHVRIRWRDALMATCTHEFPDDVDLNDQKLKDWREQALCWAYANEKGMDALLTELSKGAKQAAELVNAWMNQEAQVPLRLKGNEDAKSTPTHVTEANVDGLGKKPVHIVLARPFIEHEMHSAIVAVAGRDTGCTLFGPADMQLSANTQVKVIEGHYTGHFKSVITKPENVFVARDICCSRYVAGANCDFFARGGDGKFTARNVRENMTKRLGANSRTHSRHASILAFPMSELQRSDGSIDTCMSVTTRLLPWETSPVNVTSSRASFPGGDKWYGKINQPFALTSVHYGEDQRAAMHQDYMSQGSMNNALCFLGPHRVFNPYSKRVMQLVPGQGHFGPDAVPGDARWRRGESVSLKSAREHMVEQPLVPPVS